MQMLSHSVTVLFSCIVFLFAFQCPSDFFPSKLKFLEHNFDIDNNKTEDKKAKSAKQSDH